MRPVGSASVRRRTGSPCHRRGEVALHEGQLVEHTTNPQWSLPRPECPHHNNEKDREFAECAPPRMPARLIGGRSDKVEQGNHASPQGPTLFARHCTARKGAALHIQAPHDWQGASLPAYQPRIAVARDLGIIG